MKTFAILIAGAVLFAVPAGAQTVMIKKGHGGHDGARAEMRGHGGGHGMRARGHGHGHGKTVIIKRRGHHH